MSPQNKYSVPKIGQMVCVKNFWFVQDENGINLSVEPVFYGQPTETTLDRIELPLTFSDGTQHIPKPKVWRQGQNIIYFGDIRDPNNIGLWTSLEEWTRCSSVIQSRPYPGQALIRVCRIAEDNFSKIVVWEGYCNSLVEAMRSKERFLSMSDLFFEWRLAHGWVGLEQSTLEALPVALGRENDSRYKRFYLAHLIGIGASLIRSGDRQGLWGSILSVAAIGRRGLVNGSHNLWGLLDRLPRSNRADAAFYYGVGLLTNLDPVFLSQVDCSGLSADIGRSRYVMQILRSDYWHVQICTSVKTNVIDHLKAYHETVPKNLRVSYVGY